MKPRRILLFLPKGFEILEAGAFIDIFGWYRDLCKGDIQVVTCALNKQVSGSFGVSLNVDMALDEVSSDDFCALAIPGGFGYHGFYEEAFNPRVLELITTFSGQNKPIAAICVAALMMGKSGVLQGKRATTYPQMDGVRLRQLEAMGAIVVDAPLVVDENLLTCWGPAQGPAVALELLKLLAGADAANRVAEMSFWGRG